MPRLEHMVAKGAITPGYAADMLLQKFIEFYVDSRKDNVGETGS